MFVTEAYAQSAPTVGETHTETPAVGQPQPEATHTETGVAHGAEHGASGVFPPFDQSTYASQVLWLAITFGLFYLLMQKVIVPRVGGILENRHGRIAQDLDEAARLKTEADAAVETYEKELAAARAKASSIGSAARDAAKAKADADRAAIEAGLAEKLVAAEKRIAGIKEQAFADVGAIAEETATAIVDQLVGAKVKDTDVKAAIAAASNVKGA
ncbi:F0F1 ATP synthase subunit B [Rhizobium oryzihabitans]|jgi:F-type H+-transporting ATPase subunit b|uniref:ATP synthase subunit b n=1 Tax=Rhizobium oryzihabitans TaxID=2267833 RepID=A0A7L5BG17_9HYPH|nr:F0F1 ATP synthase subunit B [Rhizobium oryzihabitans]MCW0980220.1 F0F1 ATP synthase subunit B [Agrobacterium sp. BT-220-3]QCM04153.1 F0F1 ATP synthase subunit B [Agrobacterium tumefaciens]CUX08780.1 ATP synthase subunit B', membrane-bound, F0 sector [Agrobacterium genomosp. 5 str. CFBP 6626]HBT68086.1 F0F1 ATP synthase subunit B' [Agrobacterium sp.]QIB37857.1 F0F1 ATP synthase subunit B [Rhizobium oryzihabitans]